MAGTSLAYGPTVLVLLTSAVPTWVASRSSTTVASLKSAAKLRVERRQMSKSLFTLKILRGVGGIRMIIYETLQRYTDDKKCHSRRTAGAKVSHAGEEVQVFSHEMKRKCL